MLDEKFNGLLAEMENFNSNESLQNTENYLKIVKNPVYNELKRASVKNCQITNTVLREFLDIVFVKINDQVMDDVYTRLKNKLT